MSLKRSNSGVVGCSSDSAHSSHLPRSSKILCNGNDLKPILDDAILQLDRMLSQNVCTLKEVQPVLNKLLAESNLSIRHFWALFIESLIDNLGKFHSSSQAPNAPNGRIPDRREVIISWILFGLSGRLKKLDNEINFELPKPADLYDYVKPHLDSADRLVSYNAVFVLVTFLNLYSNDQIQSLIDNKPELLHLFTNQITTLLRCYQQAYQFEVAENEAPEDYHLLMPWENGSYLLEKTIYCFTALQFCIDSYANQHDWPRLIDNLRMEHFFNSLSDLYRNAQLLYRVDVNMLLVTQPKVARLCQLILLIQRTLASLACSLPQDIFRSSSQGGLTAQNWVCGMDRAGGWSIYQISHSLQTMTVGLKYFYFEVVFLTAGSIRIGVCPKLKHHSIDNYEQLAAIDGFDETTWVGPYERAYWKGKQQLAIKTAQLPTLTEGSILGCLLDYSDNSIRFFLNNVEMIPETGDPVSHYNPETHHITFMASTFQQALFLHDEMTWQYTPEVDDLKNMPFINELNLHDFDISLELVVRELVQCDGVGCDCRSLQFRDNDIPTMQRWGD